MDILVPSIPKRLAITPTMLDDFIIDPVLGARVIMGFDLDAFQKVRLRTFWWVPEVIDSSGFGTGKTDVGLWLFVNLRCVLVGDQICGVYYQTFETGKQTFWMNYSRRHAPIFAAQLGKFSVDEDEAKGKANTKGAGCYNQHFKNGSEIKMPASNWERDAIGQASLTYNVIAIDEWPKADAMGEGINKQILGRLRRKSRSQDHPIWCNHQVFVGVPETPNHPGHARIRTLEKRINAGDPTCSHISFCYKDFSNLKIKPPLPAREGAESNTGHVGKSFKEVFRIEKTILRMKATLTAAHFRREVCGLWAREGKGWYSDEMIELARRLGAARSLRPYTGRGAEEGSLIDGRTILNPPSPAQLALAHYFMGADPAPALGKKSDDGALTVLRAMPHDPLIVPGSLPGEWRLDFTWGYKLRGASVDQWSGLIHQKYGHFQFSGICLDFGAGGQGPSIYLKLRTNQQFIAGIQTMATPITTPEDTVVGDAHFILVLFKRKDVSIEAQWPSHTMPGDDNLIHRAHVAFQEAFEHGLIGLPIAYDDAPREDKVNLSVEADYAWRVLSQGAQQLMNIVVETKSDGSWATTGHGALKFSAQGKKDIAYSMLYAYVSFLVWLKMREMDWTPSSEDAGMCYVMK